MKEITVGITGVTPLLVNRFHEDARDEASSGVHSPKERLGPHDDAASRLYLLDGKPYVPAEWLRQSMIGEAGQHKIGRRSSTPTVAGSIFLSPDALLISPAEWIMDERAVVIPATRGRITRFRPRFDTWQVQFTLSYEPEMVSSRLLRDIVDGAGRRVGIGDYRPARKGPFGRFSVTKWEGEV